MLTGAWAAGAFWLEVRSLVRDGVAFARGGGRGGGGRGGAGGYESLKEGSGPKRRGERGEGKERKEKKRGKERDRGKGKGGGAGERSSAAEAPVHVATEPAAAPDKPSAEPKAAGTVAGDGGRWVHVPG